MIGKGNRSTRRKPAPVLLCPPQIPHAARKRTRVAAVGSQRLTAWATTRPWGYIFLRDAGWLSTVCTALYPRRCKAPNPECYKCWGSQTQGIQWLSCTQTEHNPGLAIIHYWQKVNISFPVLFHFIYVTGDIKRWNERTICLGFYESFTKQDKLRAISKRLISTNLQFTACLDWNPLRLYGCVTVAV
jgi:hypothetical protein